jgi:16S rRNA U516 pseudouridylate synthase RsuA-like enzyme
MFRMKRKLFSLERIQFGPIELGNIPLGAWRDLKESEIKSLHKMKD